MRRILTEAAATGDATARALFYRMRDPEGLIFPDRRWKFAFDGGKTYRLRLPGPVPVRTFWSAIVYDTQTRSMLQTDNRFPSVSSQKPGLQVNPDRSVDVWFGPTAPAGRESNWVQTIPGKSWFVILRLYGPLQPWFDKSWKPGDIELQG